MRGIADHLTFALSLLLMSCGIEGMMPPPPGDLSAIQRLTSPNTCLAAPAGFTLVPDIPTRHYDLTPAQLFAAVRDAIMARPRTSPLALDTSRLRADYVVRSRVFAFADIVSAQVLPNVDGTSGLVIYSYSLKGHYDFGVNRDRVSAILNALDALQGPRS